MRKDMQHIYYKISVFYSLHKPCYFRFKLVRQQVIYLKVKNVLKRKYEPYRHILQNMGTF